MKIEKRKIVILGGGFGGIKTALQLCDNFEFEVYLISDQKNFRYYPTLYKTATGGNKSASSIPLNEIFDNKNIIIVNDTAEKIDRTGKQVFGTSGKKYPYDYLVVALGVVTNYFDIKGLRDYSYGIKSQEEANELKDHLHKLIADEGKPDLNYVIIGGGPTGVELAGVLPGYIKYIMKKHGVANKTLHIDLVEAAPRLVPRMSAVYSKAVARRLKKLGVKLYLNQTVQAETADALMVNRQPIKSHTVIWTAGVTNHPFLKVNKFALNDHGKAIVNQYLQTEDGIYVIGDNADTPHSGMAQTALYDAVFITNNIKRISQGRQPKPYLPKKPVYVTPVGNYWAAVAWGRFQFFGILGWWLRNLADFFAYNDFEPWWKASKHWVAQFETEETCKVCDRR